MDDLNLVYMTVGAGVAYLVLANRQEYQAPRIRPSNVEFFDHTASEPQGTFQKKEDPYKRLVGVQKQVAKEGLRVFKIKGWRK